MELDLRSLSRMDLNLKDVCLIMKAAARFGVSEVQWSGLVLKFQPGQAVFSPQSLPPSKATSGQIEPDALKAEEARIRERQVEELIIDDPARYEELLSQNLLEDDTDAIAEEADDRRS